MALVSIASVRRTSEVSRVFLDSEHKIVKDDVQTCNEALRWPKRYRMSGDMNENEKAATLIGWKPDQYQPEEPYDVWFRADSGSMRELVQGPAHTVIFAPIRSLPPT